MNKSAWLLLVMWFRNSSRACEPFDTVVVTFAASPCCSSIERRLDASAVISELFTTSRSILFLLTISRPNFRVCPLVTEITHISKLQGEKKKPPLPNSVSCEYSYCPVLIDWNEERYMWISCPSARTFPFQNHTTRFSLFTYCFYYTDEFFV